MIPYYFQRLYNFNGRIISYKNGEYPYLEKYCKGLKLEFVKKHKRINHKYNIYCERSVLKYLFTNAKKIDILNLEHLTEENVRYGVIFKLLNKKGFLYLKLDAHEEFIKKKDFYRDKKPNYYRGFLGFINFRIIKKINQNFLKVVDLISVESKELLAFLKKKYPKLKRKIIFLPNGIDDESLKSFGINRIQYKEKENVILTVGRLGTGQKNTELLLEAISRIQNLKDWKVILAGPTQENFKEYIKNYFIKFPHLKEKVNFTGEITDRTKLLEYYQKSKIFCLPSTYEGFPLVLVEAAYFGNYIVGTNLLALREVTKNGSLGALFESGNCDELVKILQDLISNEQIMEKNCLKMQKHAEENYTWSKIIPKLYTEILKRWKR